MDTLSIRWVQIAIGALLVLVLGYAFLILRDLKIRSMKRRAFEEKKREIIEQRKKLSTK
jgi:uncharacterized membrane-anchored protein YhcB (DUF1043 family)